ncbi:PAS domain-containing protein [Caballeronia sp. GACF5]|uniref:PAS domain-containing protein n=1 Tax=Caballeronia sp. GACF5 TaxID=2921746 RepID=UPI002028CC59|nr:PAS domain-containing protein [Caballeronia sp. GACF5]
MRWFTPAVSELLPLRASDTGRRITDLVPAFADNAFYADIAAVIKTGDPREAEVRHMDGRWLLRKVWPHASKDAGACGAAINFTDISAHKLAEHLRREIEKQRGFLLEMSDLLRTLTGKKELQQESVKRLRLFFDCALVFYQEAGSNEIAQCVVENRREIGSALAVPFGGALLASVLVNRLGVADLNIADTRTSADDQLEWAELRTGSAIRSVLGVSLRRDGDALATLCLCDTSARLRSEESAILLQDPAERIWDATTRARAESARGGSGNSLRRSEA